MTCLHAVAREVSSGNCGYRTVIARLFNASTALLSHALASALRVRGVYINSEMCQASVITYVTKLIKLLVKIL